MYFYTGKSLDGFENAMNMLFINNGYNKVKHLDCVAMRNSSMSNADKMSYWFHPTINTLESLAHIKEAVQAAELFEVREITQLNKSSIWQTKKPFVLGPINKKRFFNKIDANFYDGYRNYIYCFHCNEQWWIHEPDGVPFVMCDEKDIENFMKERKLLYQIFMNPNQQLQLRRRKEILMKWLKCKKACMNHPDEIKNYDYTKIQGLSASNELELKFGLQNYMIQTYKIILMIFEDHAKHMKYSKHFQAYANEIAGININKNFKQLASTIKKTDDLLMQIIMEEMNQ